MALIRYSGSYGFENNDELIAAIKQWGIYEYDDKLGVCVMDCLHNYTREEIDIICSFITKPFYRYNSKRLWYPFISDTHDDHDLYVAQKILEYDKDGVYARYVQPEEYTYDCGRILPNLTVFDALKELIHRSDGKKEVVNFSGYYTNVERIKMHLELINSHRNRHLSLFELLQYYLKEEKYKKLRIY